MEWKSWTLDSYYETPKGITVEPMSAAESRNQQKTATEDPYIVRSFALFTTCLPTTSLIYQNTEPWKKALNVCARPGRDLSQEMVKCHIHGVEVPGCRKPTPNNKGRVLHFYVCFWVKVR